MLQRDLNHCTLIYDHTYCTDREHGARMGTVKCCGSNVQKLQHVEKQKKNNMASSFHQSINQSINKKKKQT